MSERHCLSFSWHVQFMRRMSRYRACLPLLLPAVACSAISRSEEIFGDIGVPLLHVGRLTARQSAKYWDDFHAKFNSKVMAMTQNHIGEANKRSPVLHVQLALHSLVPELNRGPGQNWFSTSRSLATSRQGPGAKVDARSLESYADTAAHAFFAAVYLTAQGHLRAPWQLCQ